MMVTDILVAAVNCSPSAGGKTAAALECVLEGVRSMDAEAKLLEMGSSASVAEVVDALHGASGFVFGSPMYRGTFTAQFKALMDQTPRGRYGEPDAPLTARTALTVATAGSDHHMLGAGRMRDVLVDFFAAHVVSPGVYLTPSDLVDGALADEAADLARLMGRALVELVRSIDGSSALRSVSPIA